MHLTELAKYLSCAPSSTFALLKTMVSLGYLEYLPETHTYVPATRVALMGELTASIAHEINQPLCALASGAQALRRLLGPESPDLAEARAAARDVAADAQRAAVASQPGDVVYLTLEVQDSAKARAFYEAVLGWRFTPGPFEDGWSVEGILPMTGMSGGHQQATSVPVYSVPDVRKAVERMNGVVGVESDGVSGSRFWFELPIAVRESKAA